MQAMVPSTAAGEIVAEVANPGQHPQIAERSDLAPSTIPHSAQLFRTEVLAERQTQFLGTVLLVPRLSDRLFTIATMVFLMAVIGLMFFGEYTRKARINGWMVPNEGLVRVFTPQPGLVTKLLVREGQEVNRGQQLLILSAETQSNRLGATQAHVVGRLAERREALSDERAQREGLLSQQRRDYAKRLAALRQEQAQVDSDVELMQTRVKLSDRNVAMNRELRNQGFISEQRMQMVEGEMLEQRARLGTLQRQRIALLRDQTVMEGELNDLPLRTRAEIATIKRNIAMVEQELAEAEARREIVITAPQDGIVTAILADLGGQANSASLLLSIVPTGSKLEAHLYAPSRAIGFVHPGQRVLLRYQAYPYQKFGHYEGTVASVSRSAVSPGELPPQLSSIAGVTGGSAAISGAGVEPVYRITVKPARQTITAYGDELPLQTGMQLEADIALEKRRLYEWVLDPLYTITGKWRG